ncbi:MAG TPA: BamA/TamA family outer membrane protein [Puia sp.]
MSYCRQVTSSRVRPAFVPAILIFTLFSCRVPVDFQRGKPFVYKTTIKVEGNIKGDEKQDLQARLQNQLDDSLQTKTVTAFFPWPHIVYKKLANPPVFDTTNLSRSIYFMNSLLNSNGYYSPQIKDTFVIRSMDKNDSLKEQRVTVQFIVKPGKQMVFDSVGFSLTTPEFQRIAMQSRNQSLLKVGQPYSKQLLTSEVNRLVDSFRNNGYFRFTKEDLYVEHDTVFSALIDPSLDPIEQAELLEKLRQKKENPTVTVVVKQRPARDTTHLIKYFIGQATVYPDLAVGVDTIAFHSDTTIINQIKFITQTNKFKLPFIANNIYLLPGGLYKQQLYFRTSNRLSQLPAWQYNNIEFQRSPYSDSLLDMTIRMYLAKKQKVSVSLETSYNTNDIVTTSNVFGTSIILSLQNRNAFRQSILTNTSLSAGLEIGSNTIKNPDGSYSHPIAVQTILAALSHTVVIPRIIHIIPFVKFPANLEQKGFNTQTLINVNANYTRRIDFFTMVSVNGSFGYQWSKTTIHSKNDKSFPVTKSYIWKPINIENTTLPYTTDSFKNYLDSNPAFRLSFRPGLVIGQSFAYNIVRAKGNKINYFLVDFEQSGALLGLLKNLDRGPLLRYIKGEMEFRHNIDYGKNQLVFRAYGGAGYAYGLADTTYEHTLPFFKAFYSGGPNSMRAWQVRNLGLGSSKYYSNQSITNDNLRFGDVKLEFNAEYRFLLGTLFGIKFKSALFTDIGNIWNWKVIDSSAAAIGSDFQLNRFYKEFAYGAGTGLRLDFNYFLIRLDWSYKIHDPQALEGSDKWFYDLKLGSGQLQLGINYPF